MKNALLSSRYDVTWTTPSGTHDGSMPLDERGKLHMHPAQALETWWECTNPMPEIAGLHAITKRLVDLPDHLVSSDRRIFWKQFLDKIPPLPTTMIEGEEALAPAEKYANKRNVENADLYAVFPFRQFALNRPNPEVALRSLDRRVDRGDSGWRQDDIFMAYLGLAEQAKRNLVTRARSNDEDSRFPAIWGPNFDWKPDQCHGGVLVKTLQSMLMQCDGSEILLLPAWPSGWDADFELHAPYQTVVRGSVRGGEIEGLEVSPVRRRADIRVGKDMRRIDVE